MESRFKILKLLSVLFKIIGIMLGLISILLALIILLVSILGPAFFSGMSGSLVGFAIIYLLGSSGILAGILYALLTLVVGGLITILFYAGGELIILLISLEENSRITTLLLQNKTKSGKEVIEQDVKK